MNIKCVYSTMPRCKHKLYCVCVFLRWRSQLIANQTVDGPVGFVPMS